MDYIAGADRNQMILFPEVVDEYIEGANAVRFIEAFVGSLDLLGLGFKSAVLAETGRPPYNPKDLLKLYLYGYLNSVRSSRRLEKEAARNLEVMWLLGKLLPDFKTIADFRKDNTEALRQVCREFVLVCKEQELFGGELVAIDGSKFLAVNANFRNFTPKRLQRAIGEIDEKVDQYLRDLEIHDQQESSVKKVSVEELKEKIEKLKKRKSEYAVHEETLERTGQNQISLTDPESRSMMVNGVTDVAYNVQTAVDAKHHLIVDHEVVNHATDQNELYPMAQRAKEALGVEELTVVADMGYYHGAHVKKCEEQNITVYTAKPETSANAKLGLFHKDVFIYDSKSDTYQCPANQTLTYRFTTDEGGRLTRYYTTPKCGKCPLKTKCTRGENRRITRWIHEEVLDRMRQRVREHPEVMRLRQCIVEHPFGTIKRWMDQGYFLMKGLPKVRAEMSLSVLAYNMKRAMKVLGVPKLIEAVT